MNKTFFFSILMLPFILMAQNTKTPYDYVNPMLGTSGHVHNYPGATLPFGSVQLSPDTDLKGWDWCSGYHYSDSTLLGFSHSHLSGTGWADLGDILLMPTTGEVKMNPGDKNKPGTGYRSRFSHKDEVAKAGYYSVLLKDYGVKAELTCTERVGFHRYTFPETDKANIIIDPTNKIFGKVIETSVKIGYKEVTGYCLSDGWGGRRYVYFVATFSKEFVKGCETMGATNNAPENNKIQKAWLRFNTKKGEAIEVNVALSAISLESARKNMKAEAENKNFDQVQKEAKQKWEEKLNKITVEGGTDNDKTIFYTGLYHCYLAPTLSMDVDGKYIACGKTLEAKGFTNYSTWSYWDTHRATHPLFTILEQKATTDFANSLISRYTDAKDHMPVWELCGYDNTCMIGYHSVSVIWDAIAKGIKGIDYNNAFKAMKDASLVEKESSSDGAFGITDYIKYGYTPSNYLKSVSKTLENSYDDWCIAQLASKLNLKDELAIYTKRSNSFENLFNKEKKAFYPKDAQGNWIELKMNDWNSLMPHYISGNFWDYEFYLPHNIDRLIELKGGEKDFEQSLDELFGTELKMDGEQHVDISGFFGKYAHGDEPGHNIPYLYNYTDSPWKTQAIVNKILKEFYFNTPLSMPNNEDCGQMSAWYVFSTLGFYPICPGKAEYTIGAPLFTKATIKLENGKTFTIKTKNLTDKNIYVANKFLNSKALSSWTLNHQDIMNGGELLFEMNDKH